MVVLSKVVRNKLYLILRKTILKLNKYYDSYYLLTKLRDCIFCNNWMVYIHIVFLRRLQFQYKYLFAVCLTRSAMLTNAESTHEQLLEFTCKYNIVTSCFRYVIVFLHVACGCVFLLILVVLFSFFFITSSFIKINMIL